MAKPIEPTPVLRGKYALRFIRMMKETEARTELTPIEKEFKRLMKENEKLYKNVKTTL